MAKSSRGGKRTRNDFNSVHQRMGDYAKRQDRFFGRVYDVSKKYFHYEHYIDDDNIIINTNNIKVIKGEPVLIVNDDQAVYVKDWNVRMIHNYDEGYNGYAVKLQRKYFKPYTFRNSFEGYAFEKPDTFDSLVQVAKEQDRRNMKVANRHMG